MENKGTESKQKAEKIANNCAFSKENVNMGRQPEFDYIKTLIIFIMIFQHVYENYSRDCLSDMIDFLGFIFGADVFMTLMGIGMKYSRNHSPSTYVSRGILLLTKGQCVNLLKAGPNLIAWWTTGNKKFISRALLILNADILIFAGFSFLLFALMKKMKKSDNFILNIGIIMNIVNFILYNIVKPPKNFLLSQFLGYFILTDAETYFPFFSYFVFVAFGYWLGEFYKKLSNKDKFYNLILIFCLPTATIYYYFRSHYNFPMFPEYYSDEQYALNPGPDAAATTMITLTGLAIFYKIDMMLKGKTPYFITHCGKNLNQYYMISYIITMQMNIFLRATKGDNYPWKMKYPTLFAIMIFVLCKISIYMNDNYIHFSISDLKNSMKNFIFAFIWIITIISVIYIYPKVEVYTTFWNFYLYET